MKPGGKRRIIVPPELGPPVSRHCFVGAKRFSFIHCPIFTRGPCRCLVGGAFNIFQRQAIWSFWYWIAKHSRLHEEDNRFLFRCCLYLTRGNTTYCFFELLVTSIQVGNCYFTRERERERCTTNICIRTQNRTLQCMNKANDPEFCWYIRTYST